MLHNALHYIKNQNKDLLSIFHLVVKSIKLSKKEEVLKVLFENLENNLAINIKIQQGESIRVKAIGLPPVSIQFINIHAPSPMPSNPHSASLIVPELIILPK